MKRILKWGCLSTLAIIALLVVLSVIGGAMYTATAPPKQAVLVPTVTPTSAPSLLPTETPRPTSTAMPLPTATSTATPTPVPTATATHTPKPTNTPASTATAMPVPTATNTPSPTTTPLPTALPWYAGGTLHDSTIAEWQAGSDVDQLATAADWITNVYKPEWQTLDELRSLSDELLACVNDVAAVAVAAYGADSSITDWVVWCIVMMMDN